MRGAISLNGRSHKLERGGPINLTFDFFEIAISNHMVENYLLTSAFLEPGGVSLFLLQFSENGVIHLISFDIKLTLFTLVFFRGSTLHKTNN